MKYIIFDMDGVLINSMPKHIIAWKKALLKYNIKVNNLELALNEGANQKLFLDKILKKCNIKKNAKEKKHTTKLIKFFVLIIFIFLQNSLN